MANNYDKKYVQQHLLFPKWYLLSMQGLGLRTLKQTNICSSGYSVLLNDTKLHILSGIHLVFVLHVHLRVSSWILFWSNCTEVIINISRSEYN